MDILYRARCNFWIVFAIILSFFYGQSLKATSWDIEYWQFLSLKNWESGPFKLYTHGELRIDQDVSKFYYYRIGENFVCRVLKWLSVEAHYNYIYHIPIDSSNFKTAHRIDLEVNPLLHMKNGTELIWRNRFELIKNQGNPEWQSVFRHRVQTVFSIKGFNKLISVNFSDEVFYHFNLNKFTENRFIPCELTFQFSQLKLDLFVMIRNLFSAGTGKWHRNLVFGTTLSF